ncbi:MAG: hypothetical protein U0798_00420 [Gemmataceae bacterium]
MLPVPVCLLHVLAGLLPQLGDLQFKSQFVREMAADNQKAIAAVKTLSCNFKTIDILPNRANNLSTELLVDGYYARKGADFRTTYRFQLANIRLQNCMLRNGIEIRHFERRTPPDRVTLQEVGTKKSDDPGNIINRLLVNHVLFNDMEFNLFTFDELRGQPHQVLKAEQQKNGDSETRYVKLAVMFGTMEFWIDTESRGWFRKMIYRPRSSPDDQHVWEVIHFHRAADGAVIPSLVSRKWIQKDILRGHVHTALSDMKLNEPLADKELVIPDLAGKVCSDLDKKVRYVIDENGHQAGPDQSDPSQLNLPQPQPIYPDLRNEHAYPKEAITKSDIIAMSFVSILVLSGLIWMVRSQLQARRVAAASVASPAPGSLPGRNRPSAPPVRRS